MSPTARRISGEPRRGLAKASLVLGVLSIPSLGCLGIGALAAIALGIVALAKAKDRPTEYGGTGLAWGGVAGGVLGLLLVPVAGIVAAIAIPSLLRARVSANEAATIGDIRTVISAQAAYQSANQGYFAGRLECLSAPATCLPDYPATGPTFIDTTLSSGGPRVGYLRELHPGPDAPEVSDTGAPLAPASTSAFAFVAVPLQRGQTGVRGFCGDSRGIICMTPDGAAPTVEDGQCDLATCQLLQ